MRLSRGPSLQPPKPELDRSKADAVSMGKRRRFSQSGPVHVRAVLAFEILDDGVGSSDRDARMMPRDAWRLEPHGDVGVASQQVSPNGQRDLSVLPDNPAAHSCGLAR